MNNRERITRSLDLLRDGLRPMCEGTWKGSYGVNWLTVVNSKLHTSHRNPTTDDLTFLFNGMKATWKETFGRGFPPAIRSLVFELSAARNEWAHQGSFTGDDTIRALDSMERLLDAFHNSEQRQEIHRIRRELMIIIVEGESPPGPKYPPAPPPPQPQGTSDPGDGSLTRIPTAIQLWGHHFVVESCVEVLVRVTEALHQRHGTDFLNHLLAPRTPRGRPRFASRYKNEFPPRRARKVRSVGIYLYNGDLTCERIRSRAHKFLGFMGYPSSDLEILY